MADSCLAPLMTEAALMNKEGAATMAAFVADIVPVTRGEAAHEPDNEPDDGEASENDSDDNDGELDNE